MKNKHYIIAGTVIATMAGFFVYSRYFTEPRVRIHEIDKKLNRVIFSFSNKRYVLDYENLNRPKTIYGRLDFYIKIIKRENRIEFHKMKEGHLVEYPSSIAI